MTASVSDKNTIFTLSVFFYFFFTISKLHLHQVSLNPQPLPPSYY